MQKVVTIATILLVAALILPIALGQFAAASTASWQTNWVTMFNILPVMGLLALVIAIVYMAVKTKKTQESG